MTDLTLDNKKAGRLAWIDWAKALLMFCVVLTHTHCFKFNIVLNYLDMPAFLMISGFLYKKVSVREELKKSLKGLVIPYLFFNIILIIVSMLLRDFDYKVILNVILGNQEGLPSNYFRPLWFLVSIFLIRLVCSLCKESWYPLITIISFVVSIVLSLLKVIPYDFDYFQLFTTIMCFPFFYCGMAAKRYKLFDLPEKIKPKYRYVILGITLIILLSLIYLNGGANIFRCKTGNNVILYYFLCISFSYCILYIISILFKKSLSITNTIASGTVLILGLQQLIINGILYQLPKNTLSALLVAIIVMAICIPMIMFAERFCPFVLGGRGKK